ncbi:FAD-dependent monooxygenase [Actinoplanes sp. KI2]|uniref:FAD-dependent monooxygenase n=1 Tax=Actinoplanes sp. KI2 TaxID=2983315 RepID=UPI0021D5A3BB|nr:FAD-dependent monooxygenase [Actinoplanes sp. KI2]MCU7727499.1 FAD-dependent monooxygenase [Actinoplanes sp. KI2]
MQFYLNGYPEPPRLPATTDVLIVGAGPAGLLLAAQLATFPDVRCVVIDRRDGPLEVGQADGVACRTVEMFETFGLAQRLIHEGYRVNEVAFWRPDPKDPARIVRTGRIDDVEEGISEMPHMIVNQARMLGYLRDRLRPGDLFYGLRATGVDIDPGGVTVTVEPGRQIRASYVVGCDGAHSTVREAIGRRLVGDSADQYWGVLDVLAVTDFPDIRLKSVIQSSRGSILVIPREGGYLVRLYIELGAERPPNPSPETLLEVANRILQPYAIEVKNVGWWTVYEIGQRLCDGFDDGGEQPRVFIAGDACHTHSAKAGQGMNVSMADAFNLGWKLGAVLRGTAPPAILRTYSAERQRVARQLIDFDREFAGSFSARPDDFQEYFREQGRFTAGLSVRYEPSMLTAPPAHQHLASGFPIGMRFHSAPVVRVADAKPMHLGHAARADGAWRLYAFADRSRARFLGFCDFLTSDGSPLTRFTPPDADPDAVIDVRAILQQPHREVAVDELPPVLQPRKGPYRLVDYEKVFAGDDIFTARGVDREQGCVVVVRPDQYVANVLPLDAYEELDVFLSGVLVGFRSIGERR